MIAITKSSSRTCRKQSVTLECDRKLKKQLNLRQHVAKKVGKNHIELDQSIKNDEDYKKYVGEKIMEKLTAPLDRLKAKRQRETTIFQDEGLKSLKPQKFYVLFSCSSNEICRGPRKDVHWASEFG